MQKKLLRLTALPRLGEVQAARARVTAARARWTHSRLGNCALAIDAQAHGHPLTCVGVAAGAGLALGLLAVRPWRALEIGSLVSRHLGPLAARLMTMARDAGQA